MWRDPRLGDQPLGEWFRGWIATRGDLAPSARALSARLLERWIDAEVPVVGETRPRIVRLRAMSLASVTPAAVREWDAAVLAEASRRAGERWAGRRRRRGASRREPRPVIASVGLRLRLQRYRLRESGGEDFAREGTRRHDVDPHVQKRGQLIRHRREGQQAARVHIEVDE